MKKIVGCITLAALATCLLLAGRASASDGNQCGSSTINSGVSVVQNAVWRMEVREDEAAFGGPSLHDRLNHHWNQTAKGNYRWTSVIAPVDTGTSTELMTISAVVIADGVPSLRRGDIVDVYVVSGIKYSKRRGPVVVRRVCSGRDVGCVGRLRKTQDGRVVGVEVGGRYSVARYQNCSASFAKGGRSAPQGGCRGEVTAVLQ